MLSLLISVTNSNHCFKWLVMSAAVARDSLYSLCVYLVSVLMLCGWRWCCAGRPADSDARRRSWKARRASSRPTTKQSSRRSRKWNVNNNNNRESIKSVYVTILAVVMFTTVLSQRTPLYLYLLRAVKPVTSCSWLVTPFKVTDFVTNRNPYATSY